MIFSKTNQRLIILSLFGLLLINSGCMGSRIEIVHPEQPKQPDTNTQVETPLEPELKNSQDVSQPEEEAPKPPQTPQAPQAPQAHTEKPEIEKLEIEESEVLRTEILKSEIVKPNIGNSEIVSSELVPVQMVPSDPSPEPPRKAVKKKKVKVKEKAKGSVISYFRCALAAGVLGYLSTCDWNHSSTPPLKALVRRSNDDFQVDTLKHDYLEAGNFKPFEADLQYIDFAVVPRELQQEVLDAPPKLLEIGAPETDTNISYVMGKNGPITRVCQVTSDDQPYRCTEWMDGPQIWDYPSYYWIDQPPLNLQLIPWREEASLPPRLHTHSEQN